MQAVNIQNTHNTQMKAVTYDDAVVRAFTAVTVLWGVVAFLVGVIVAAQRPRNDDIPIAYSLDQLGAKRWRPAAHSTWKPQKRTGSGRASSRSRSGLA